MTKRRHQTKAGRLRQLLAAQTIVLPGAFNALTALQTEQAGYEALYVSGAALSAVRGCPDIGLLSLEDVTAEAGRIAQAVSIPVLVDADTGFGPPSALAQTVRSFERAGLAGMQIEDQQLPKRCGHLGGKQLVPIAEMSGKIQAAAEARRDPDFLIVARTDARGVEGLDAAVERALAYVQAGADALFPEALETEAEFQTFAEHVRRAGANVPLIANMTEFGKSPYLSVPEFEALGYRAVLFPVSLLRVAMGVLRRFLLDLRHPGAQKAWLPQMLTRAELYQLLQYDPTDTHEWRRHESDGQRAASR